jgi:uncharacterized protein
MSILAFVLLLAASFLAGLVDAVAGGGGLVQLPALFILCPELPVATALGTNKVASICGTATAVRSYALHVRVPWRVVGWCAPTAAVASYVGAEVVRYVDPAVLKPFILVLIVLVAVYTFRRKDLGETPMLKLDPSRALLLSMLTGLLLGFYDGFFGPGTGSFLIFVFVTLFGFRFLEASASAKIVNLSTNIAACASFLLAGHVRLTLGLPMALCNVAGSLVGTRLAVRNGTRFIRALFLVVLGAIIIRFSFDILYR